MAATGASPLKSAANLIRAGKASQAQAVVVQVLRDEPNNSQAWFLLSYTQTDPERQKYALQQALRWDPGFERARERLERLGGKVEQKSAAFIDAYPDETEEPLGRKEEIPPPQRAFFTQDEAKDRQFGQDLSAAEQGQISNPQADPIEKPKRSRGRGCLRILLVIILMGAIGSLLFFGRDYLANLLIAPVNPTATEIQAFRTLPPTWTPSTQVP